MFVVGQFLFDKAAPDLVEAPHAGQQCCDKLSEVTDRGGAQQVIGVARSANFVMRRVASPARIRE
jgi:hypothetical protein